jgi:hypothetical protein
MEKLIFESYSCFWDQYTASFGFYDVVLKVPIGEFSSGEKFDSASIDFRNGIIYLNRGDFLGRYKISLSIG